MTIVQLLGALTDGAEVPDPYYGGDSGFTKVFKQVSRYCEAFLDDLQLSKDA